MIFLSIRLVFLFTVALTLISCNSENRGTVTEMQFNVDSTLVDKREFDSSLQISYAVPSAWQPVTASTDALQQVQSQSIQLRKILKNQSGTVVFSVTDVRAVPDSTFGSMDKNFRSILNPSGTWQNIERAEF